MSTSTRPARPLRILAIASILVLAFSASAFASTGKETIKLTSEGQAAAKATVLTKSDFSSTPGWTGGPAKPDTSSSADSACIKPGAKPLKLVTNGDQKTVFKYPGLRVTSEATVFQTAAMVRGDWQRSIGPRLLTCLRKELAKQTDKTARVVSVKTLSFPRVATYTHAIRVKMIITTKGKKVPMIDDFIFFGSGRTEGFMTTISPPTPLLAGFERHFAQLMATRIVV